MYSKSYSKLKPSARSVWVSFLKQGLNITERFSETLLLSKVQNQINNLFGLYHAVHIGR